MSFDENTFPRQIQNIILRHGENIEKFIQRIFHVNSETISEESTAKPEKSIERNTSKKIKKPETEEFSKCSRKFCRLPIEALQDASKVPFEGPEARYFRNVAVAEDSTQPFKHCLTLADFINKVDEITQKRNMGLGQCKENTDWFLYAPSDELYPHAEFIPWRMQEEQTMNLLCLGKGSLKKRGFHFGWYHKKAELCFGLYSNDKALGKILQAKWGHGEKKHTTISLNEELYDDIINSRAHTEMSIFVYVEQPFSINEIKKSSEFLSYFYDRKTNHHEQTSIDHLTQWLDNVRFTGKEDFLSADSYLKQGTKLTLRTTEFEGTVAEVISPGPWSQATCYGLGQTHDPKVSEALMRIILGREPLDMECKRQVGKNALYLAEGGSLPRSRFEASIPYLHMNDWKRPGTPPYPYPEKSHIKIFENKLWLLNTPLPEEKCSISPKILSSFKRDNRRRIEKCLAGAYTHPAKSISLSNRKEINVKLRKLPEGTTPSCIRRYPVEFPDLQSPFKFFNDPSKASIKSGYEGYEARVKEVTHDSLFRRLEIPSLEAVEDQLTCFEFPTHITTNQTKKKTEQLALLYRYLEDKKTLSYKGVYFPGDIEKIEIW